jgi:hypothetical protein
MIVPILEVCNTSYFCNSLITDENHSISYSRQSILHHSLIDVPGSTFFPLSLLTFLNKLIKNKTPKPSTF